MPMNPAPISLRLVLDVTYDAADVPAEVLKDMLQRMVARGISEGGLTGNHEATVDTYDVLVHDKPEQVDVARRLADAIVTLEEDHAEFGHDNSLDEWIVAVSRNSDSTAHPAACEFLLLTSGAGAEQAAQVQSTGTLSLTHGAISKALSENLPLTQDQRAALLGLVARDRQAQAAESDEAWDAVQVDGIVNAVRDHCGPATAARLRRLIESNPQ